MNSCREHYVKPLKKIQRNYKANAHLFQPKISSNTKRLLQYMKLCRQPALPLSPTPTKPFQCTRFTQTYFYNQGIYEQLRKRCSQQKSTIWEGFPFEKLKVSRSTHSSKFMKRLKEGIRRQEERIDQIKGVKRPQTAVKYSVRRYDEGGNREEWGVGGRPQSGEIVCRGVMVGLGCMPRPVSRYSEAVNRPRNIEFIDDL